MVAMNMGAFSFGSVDPQVADASALTGLLVRLGRRSKRPLAVAIAARSFGRAEAQLRFVRGDTANVVGDTATRAAHRSLGRWALVGEPVGGASVVVGMPPRRYGGSDSDLRAACLADVADALAAFEDEVVVSDDGLAGSDDLIDLRQLTEQAVIATVDPVAWAARGLAAAIAASAAHLGCNAAGGDRLSGVTVAVLGHTRDARALVTALHAADADVIVGDTSDGTAHPDVVRLDPAHARTADVDVLALCGDHRLGEHDLATLRCRIVVDPSPHRPDLVSAIEAAGVLVVPDLAASCGGALACRLARRGADAAELCVQIDHIGTTVQRILDQASSSSTSPQAMTDAMAQVRLVASGLFAGLSPDLLATLATALRPQLVRPGQSIVREGDHGDRFYVIAQGHVEVLVDGKTVRVQGPGEFFGEIALLRDTPRSATVRALEPVMLYTVDRTTFRSIVDREPGARATAEASIDQRLSHAAAR